MATNNAINLNQSGIVSYDGAGNFTGLANPLTVSHGGSGVGSNTVYAVLCAGTTSTGNIQSIASVGTSTQVLTSNGPGALPTFQAAAANNTGFFFWAYTPSGTSNPLKSNTYYLGFNQFVVSPSVSNGSSRIYVPSNCTINSMYGEFVVSGTLASTENCTINIRKNDTTNTAVTTTLQLNAASGTFNGTSLGISLSAGDFIDVTLVTPAWVTVPTLVYFNYTISGA